MDIKTAKTLIGVEGLDLKVKVKAIYDYNTGTHATYGDWSLQNAVLQDESDICDCVVSNRKEWTKDLIGKEISIKSFYQPKQEKKTGVKVVKETYQGKERIKIKITPSAEIKEIPETIGVPEEFEITQQPTPPTENELEKLMQHEVGFSKEAMLKLLDEIGRYVKDKRQKVAEM